ncbi:hypothetical protein Tco_1134532 [Tanacetum coccineum]
MRHLAQKQRISSSDSKCEIKHPKFIDHTPLLDLSSLRHTIVSTNKLPPAKRWVSSILVASHSYSLKFGKALFLLHTHTCSDSSEVNEGSSNSLPLLFCLGLHVYHSGSHIDRAKSAPLGNQNFTLGELGIQCASQMKRGEGKTSLPVNAGIAILDDMTTSEVLLGFEATMLHEGNDLWPMVKKGHRPKTSKRHAWDPALIFCRCIICYAITRPYLYLVKHKARSLELVTGSALITKLLRVFCLDITRLQWFLDLRLMVMAAKESIGLVQRLSPTQNLPMAPMRPKKTISLAIAYGPACEESLCVSKPLQKPLQVFEFIPSKSFLQRPEHSPACPLSLLLREYKAEAIRRTMFSLELHSLKE